MGVTVIGRRANEIGQPQSSAVPVVYKRANWSDEWELDSTLRVDRLAVHVANADLSVAELRRPYGWLQTPGQLLGFGTVNVDFDLQVRINIDNYWIRIDMPGLEGEAVETFVGRVAVENSIQFGSEVTDASGSAQPSGVQRWVVHGPLQILRKIEIYKSWSRERYYDRQASTSREELQELEFLQNVNGRDDFNVIRGNRTDDVYSIPNVTEDKYVFGGSDLWTHQQFLDYLLAAYAELPAASDADMPAWRLSGQTEILESTTEFIRLDNNDAMSLADIIAKIIDPKKGIAYKIQYCEIDGGRDCFDIIVFSLLADERVHGDAVLPANPNTVEIATTATRGVKVSYSVDEAQRFSAIDIIGERVAMAVSVFGLDENGVYDRDLQKGWDDSVIASGTSSASGGELVQVVFSAQPYKPGVLLIPTSGRAQLLNVTEGSFTWTNVGDEAASIDYEVGGAEQAYLQGRIGGVPLAAINDDVRSSDYLRNVFQRYIVDTEFDWFNKAAGLALSDLGEVDLTAADADKLRMNSIRSTLPWLPALSGYRYDVDPPANTNPANVQPDLLPPAFYVFRQDGDATDPETGLPLGRYVAAEEAGFQVAALQQDLGLFVNGRPNHRLAKDHFGDANASEDGPEFNWIDSAMTVAMRLPTRLRLSWRPPGSDDLGDRKVIKVDDAELWCLAPNTILGIGGDGQFVRSGPDLTITRNDADRLRLRMAGAIARYYERRARAQIEYKAIRPRADLLGAIVTVANDAGFATAIRSAITSVEYLKPMDSDNPRTILKTGFARGRGVFGR